MSPLQHWCTIPGVHCLVVLILQNKKSLEVGFVKFESEFEVGTVAEVISA